ncbi:MAG: hypothetical protein R3A78_15485 [Polyangiales bacterium]|nr:hypothetical protein [Myxococcales bacterium]
MTERPVPLLACTAVAFAALAFAPTPSHAQEPSAAPETTATPERGTGLRHASPRGQGASPVSPGPSAGRGAALRARIDSNREERQKAMLNRFAMRKGLLDRAKALSEGRPDPKVEARERHRADLWGQLRARLGGRALRPMPESLRKELWNHARREAKLAQIEIIAVRADEQALASRANRLRATELTRHEARIEAIVKALNDEAAVAQKAAETKAEAPAGDTTKEESDTDEKKEATP